MSMKKTLKEILGFVYYNIFQRYKKIVGNRIFLYHSIGTKLSHDIYGISISKERFMEHMKFLKEKHEIIPIDSNYKNNLVRNTISITFDDGYKDNLIALEICEKYNIPFTLYITTNEIGNKNYLNKNEILEFSKSSLCTLGVHSHTHPLLANLSYEEQFRELQVSKQVLEDIIQKKIVTMSYPHGSYDNITLEILEILGYDMVSSSHFGINTMDNFDNKRLKRIEIVALDDLSVLEKKINGWYDYLSIKEKLL